MPSGRVVFLTVRRTAGIVSRRHACRPYHIHHAGHKAEQQKHDQPPRRDAKQTIKRPADGGTDQDPGYEVAGKRKPARVSRRISGRFTATRFRPSAWPVLAKLITETPKPRGKSSLVGSALFQVVVARVIGHFDATRTPLTNPLPAPLRPPGPYLLRAGSSRIRARAKSVRPCQRTVMKG
jgi:hypothetical protein